MNTIRLDGHVLKGLDNEPVLQDGELVQLKEQAAQILRMSTEGDALKLWDIAVRMHGDDTIDLDDSDTKLVRKKIEEAKGVTVQLKAQILGMLDDLAKPKAAKKDAAEE